MFTPAAINPDKVAIYVRWSTDEQGEGTTAQVQVEACQAFLVSQGWRPTPALTFVDDGYSGGSLDRPAMTRLRKLCREGQVDCVVVFKLDRLSRSVLDTVNLVLKEWADRVYVKSAREPVDTTTAMGKQFFYMLISYAEWERNVIRERTMSGRLKRAQQGRHLSKPPFGYAAGALPGERVIVPAEAAIVRGIFERRLRGMGDRQIAAWLNTLGVKTRQGNPWHPNSVAKLLQNSLYAGTIRYGHKHPGGQSSHDQFLVEAESATPAIVTPETFARAQARRKEAPTGRAAASPHLLTGLLRCTCGASLQFKRVYQKTEGKQFGYYVCSRKLGLGAGACPSGLLPAAQVDSAIVEQFLAQLGTQELPDLQRALTDQLRAGSAGRQARVCSLQREHTQLEKGLHRLDTDYLTGSISVDRYNELRSRAESTLATLKRQLNALMAEQACHGEPPLPTFRLTPSALWGALHVREQKQLLPHFLETATAWRPVKGQWECTLYWRFRPIAHP